MDCSPPGSSLHGISQARILQWVAILLSRGSSQLRDWTWVSYIAGGFFTVWATREAEEKQIIDKEINKVCKGCAEGYERKKSPWSRVAAFQVGKPNTGGGSDQGDTRRQESLKGINFQLPNEHVFCLLTCLYASSTTVFLLFCCGKTSLLVLLHPSKMHCLRDVKPPKGFPCGSAVKNSPANAGDTG